MVGTQHLQNAFQMAGGRGGGWISGLGMDIAMDIAIIETVVKFRASTWLYCL